MRKDLCVGKQINVVNPMTNLTDIILLIAKRNEKGDNTACVESLLFFDKPQKSP